MSETKPFLTLELRCACGSSLFVELPQESAASYLSEKLLGLATAWTTHHGHGPTLEKLVSDRAHAAHHQEPKK